MISTSPMSSACWRVARGSGTYVQLPACVVICMLIFNNFWGGYIIGAADALKELYKSVGVGSEMEEERQTQFLTDLVNWSFQVNCLNFLPTGFIADYVGPKIIGVSGFLCNIFGMAFMVLGREARLYWTGSTLLGLACAAMLNAHVKSIKLFPGYSTTVLSVLGAACSLSHYVPIILQHIALVKGVNWVVYIYCGVSIACLMSDFLLLPYTSYDDPVPTESPTLSDISTRATLRTSKVSLLSAGRSVHADDDEDIPAVQASPLYGSLTRRQIFTCPIVWIYGSYHFFHVFRRNYFAHSARPTFIQIAGRDHSAEIAKVLGGQAATRMNYIQPLACIFSPICGLAVDLFGIFPIILLHNGLGMSLYLGVAFGSINFQWVSIFCFTFISAYLFSQTFSFVLQYFGLKYFGLLVGLLNIFSVLAVQVYDTFVDFIVKRLCEGNYYRAALFPAIVSILAFPLLLLIWGFIRKKERQKFIASQKLPFKHYDSISR